jgi:NADH-quinone oxidoreductase subunit G
VPVRGEDQTFTPDPREGRTGDTSFVVCRPFTIHAEKCPNRRGVEEVLRHFQGEVIGYDQFLRRAAAGDFRAAYVTSDAIDPAFGEADAAALRPRVEFLVVQDVHDTPLARSADVVLAAATFAEKAGCYVNADGRLQYSEAALPPRDGSLPDLDILSILANRGAGPIRSGPVLAEAAAAIPAFAVAAGGEVPAFGVVLGRPETADDATIPFVDPWHAPQGRQANIVRRRPEPLAPTPAEPTTA